ncbi:MAG: hypothetical protein IKK58_00145 [Clostridia bacterium]|nr:hypothetical protein [Clostridia bacterium]
MDKKTNIVFYLLCLGGGLLFGLVFFLAFGADKGFTWDLALICLIGGLFFAVAFCVVWLIVEKFSKPFTFENPKAQRMLLEYEKSQSISFQHKFCAHFLNCGKGLKQELCETFIYFDEEKVRIVFCHFYRIYSYEFPYSSIKDMRIEGYKTFIISHCDGASMVFSIKDSLNDLKELLLLKGFDAQFIK